MVCPWIAWVIVGIIAIAIRVICRAVHWSEERIRLGRCASAWGVLVVGESWVHMYRRSVLVGQTVVAFDPFARRSVMGL